MTQDIFDSITFAVAHHLCELQFNEISNPGVEHPLYEFILLVDGCRASDWIETEPTRFERKSIRGIAVLLGFGFLCEIFQALSPSGFCLR